jgi:ActR/RegA family two-component response regulator
MQAPILSIMLVNRALYGEHVWRRVGVGVPFRGRSGTVPGSRYRGESVTTAQGPTSRSSGPSLDRVSVLIVDDDERWAQVTGRLLESNREAFAVETATSYAAGRERFAEMDPDCVVSDYQLGDGTGLDLLDTVRERDTDRPFVLVTGRGSEAVASDAIGQGVTDYIRKGADDGELLASRVANAVRTYRTERALERERRSKDAMLDVLTATTVPSEVYRQFCSRLVADRGYACAWIGHEQGGDLVPESAAGREGYLDEVLDPAGDSAVATPARGAIDRGEPVVVAPIEPDGHQEESTASDRSPGRDWESVASQHGFEAVVATPVRHDGVRFGILEAYTDDATMLDGREVDDVVEYAETVGYALRTAEWKRSLVSAQPVSLDVELGDTAAPLVALAERLPESARVEVPSAVTRDDGSTLYSARVDGVEAANVRETAAAVGSLRAVDVRDGPDTVRCEFVAPGPTPEGVLAESGAQFERTVVERGVATVSTQVPDDGTVETVTGALEDRYGDATVSTIWTERGDSATRSTENPLGPLTERQLEVLSHAFHAGYFERPRGASATELAEQFDIARATLTQHLRAAQRKVFSDLLSS